MATANAEEEACKGCKKEEIDHWNKVAQATYDYLKANKVDLIKEGYDQVVWRCHDTHDRMHVLLNGRDVTKDPKRFWKSCDLCGKFPCKVQRYMEVYIKFLRDDLKDYDGRPNNEIRFAIYRRLNEDVRGIQGKDNRKRFPRCVERLVKQQFPNPEGEEYQGFKSKKRVRAEACEDSDGEMEEWEPLKVGKAVFGKIVDVSSDEEE